MRRQAGVRLVMPIGSGDTTSRTAVSLLRSKLRRLELAKAGLEGFFHSHVMRLQPHLARMTVGGIKVDLEYKAILHELLEAKLEDQREDYYRAVARATGDL
jgi:DNA polymerase I-like protein with 3'-5' exonuclease and polymerase domains